MGANKRIAVILASHGEAETLRFVENYRVSLHTLSRAATVMPIPLPLRHVISFSSSFRKRFRSASGASGSPQNRITRTQAEQLQVHLDRYHSSSDARFKVLAAHSASEPYLEAVLAGVGHYDGQIVIPMAPVDNSLICGQICRHIADSWPSGKLHRVRVIGRLWTDEALYRAYLDHLLGGRSVQPRTGGRGTALVLLFHGTIVKDGKGAEPSFHTGRAETAEFARRLAERIAADPRNPWDTITTAYLNHDVGGEWTSPSFEEVCREIRAGGFADVSLFAAGYFSDGNETLTRASVLESVSPGIRVESIPCLNDAPVFTEYLAGRVAGAAAQIFVLS